MTKTTATLFQGRRLIEVFETLGSGQLQALISSGLLTDLRRCAAELDPMKVDRHRFRQALGFDAFRVKMGGPENTDQIVKILGFPCDPLITQANFPIMRSKNPWEDEIEIVDPGKKFGREEGFQILKDQGLEPPTYEHAIRFAEQHGRTTTSEEKPFVIFLHEDWRDADQFRRSILLNRMPNRTELALGTVSSRGFDEYSVLAGVRPRKGTPIK